MAAVGVQIEKGGALRMTLGLRFTPGGSWSTIAGNVAGKIKPLLTELPDRPLVAAAGLHFSKPLHDLAPLLFGAGPGMVNPLLDQLPPEEQAKFAAAASEMWIHQRTDTVWLGSPTPGEPLLAHGVMVSKVDDSAKYLAQLEEAWNHLKLPAGEASPRPCRG